MQSDQSGLPKNIFFYWDGDSVPVEVKDNIQFFKNNNADYRVVLTNDEYMYRYTEKYPQLMQLFKLATIAALKSDIARMILLNEEGGAWIDCNTTLIVNQAIPILFEQCKSFRFVFTLLPNKRCDLKASFMIAQKHSEIAKLIIDLMTTKLWAHYLVEASTDQYHTYNYFYWVPPVVAHDLLEYQFSDNFRNEFLKKYAGQKVINPDIPAFQKFGCGLVVVDELLKFYGTNMSHHHGENMKLHWSELQKTQRLFFR